MSSKVEYVFRTKSGQCKVTNESVVLTLEGVKGGISNAVYGESMARAFVVYGIIAAASIGFAVWSFMDQEVVNGIFGCLVSAIIIGGMLIGWNASAARKIDVDSIPKVAASKPNLIMRGLFTVYFNVEGKTRKRYIMLPGISDGGQTEFEAGLMAFRSIGFPTD